MLLLVPELAGVVGFVVLFGAAKGCMTLVRPALVADLYGRAHYASIAGVLAFSVTIAQAAAPLGAGAAYDALGRYDPILWMLVLVSALAQPVSATGQAGDSAATLISMVSRQFIRGRLRRDGRSIDVARTVLPRITPKSPCKMNIS